MEETPGPIKHFFFLSLFYCILACSSVKEPAFNKDKNSDAIEIKKIEIKTKAFYDLILKSKNNFFLKYNQTPKLIVLEFYKGEASPKVLLLACGHLYPNKEQKTMLDDHYLGSTIIDNTIIVVRDNFNYYNKSLIEVKNKKTIFNINYGSIYNSCNQTFIISGTNFLLEDEFCETAHKADK